MRASTYMPLWLAAVWAATGVAGPAFKSGPFEVKSQHYRVLTDIDREAAAQIALHLEAINKQYVKAFAAFQTHVGDRYEIRVYADRESYVEEVGEKYRNTGGLCMTGDRAVVTYKGRRSWEHVFCVIYHECFHQFFRAVIGHGPPWVNEGLAEFFESAVWNKKGFDVGEVRIGRLHTLRQAFESGNYLRLGDLITMDHEQWLGNMAAGGDDPARHQYTYAWSFVHFLAKGSKGRNSEFLYRYLKAIQGGRSFQQAYDTVFGPNIEEHEKLWIAYVRQLEPTPHQVCRDNLRMLGAAVRTSASRFLKEKPDAKTFYKVVAEGKWPELRMASASKQTMCDWFRCPAKKSKRSKVTYKFEWPRDKKSFPDIVCKAHPGITYRASTVQEGGRLKSYVVCEIGKKRGKRRGRKR